MTQPTDPTLVTTATTGQRVLFVCVRNGGKSQMAAGLMRHAAEQQGLAVQVFSAGTEAGMKLNAQSVESLAEVGVDISTARTHQLTDDDVRAADLVVVLGGEARVEPVGGTPVEVWETDEPATRGIEGMERMRLVRDDISRRVEDLLDRFQRAA
ncbi:arsenate-mycothiol transferase [Quadrisphaera granulorum]|uniref:Arsenate-mycothiol transferase n=1 Tax=Quadrisphaera granulorum TaxID=317664 RepID=A0A315ZQR9_9ACTN|nr:low molecular weight phosphatase family protein [Quadrisphaera granulorum]PWJ47876.1 arsenate-mycothiol transferase [Quadrisphaera granulorum]SZE98643.1 arsenate-mycothiol transferase [Quadrisphaera granulorum]